MKWFIVISTFIFFLLGFSWQRNSIINLLIKMCLLFMFGYGIYIIFVLKNLVGM
jgi:hypothetical protein